MSNTAANQPSDTPAALVLCGGGSSGAMEVGFYQALTEFGIHANFILGSSIGALNGAYIAGGMGPDDLARLWRGFRLRHVLVPNWSWLLHPHRRPGFFSLAPLRALLRKTLPATRFEDLAIPLIVVTTDLESGRACYWSEHGDLVEPVIASMSLPGIFPPVEIARRPHIDGGVANNAPIDKAAELGARSVYLIECACSERCSRPLKGWTDVLMRSFSIALDGKYHTDVVHFDGSLTIHSVRPQLKNEVDLLDFRHSAELIETAYTQSRRMLERPADTT